MNYPAKMRGKRLFFIGFYWSLYMVTLFVWSYHFTALFSPRAGYIFFLIRYLVTKFELFIYTPQQKWQICMQNVENAAVPHL